MNVKRRIAAKAYDIYMEKGSAQLSPQDALWYTDQYLQNNTNATIEEAIESIANLLIKEF
jgi:hypothetical protein